ncbi:MAG TPA: glycerophosphodiester phosphodiesterase family protein [Candidatus Acidoferrales bacterium]|jgi:glycerophosphoryl diester phosphodiesterase|nr:glycerophosphodiester phosphodiesterase family protein [Candidatus Acidoferrales bacterium]
MQTSNHKNVWNIAHRGASGHAPENTLAAFRTAVEMGAKFIETDLQVTRDAWIVAMHDTTVNRTTDGRGQISMMNLADLRALDAGAWFDGAGSRSFAGERVPELGEILNFAREADVSFYLELKTSESWTMERSLAGALASSGELARATVISFDPAVLLSLRRIEPMAMTGMLAERAGLESIDRAVSVGARQLLPRANRVTPELIEAARRADLKVVAWTVNEPEEMRALIASGVDGIITDFPDRLAAVLAE